MTDRTRTAGTLGAVPEADLLEQSVPAYPDAPYDEGAPAEATITPAPDSPLPISHAIREADDADVLEQSIAVPMSDDYDTVTGGYDEAAGYDGTPAEYDDTER
ncbi:hypothetical protein [Nocardia sp. alder85J]|uniref:hypothetical protein n=1 Tax=Nocardia sp. alder85J TaxID=2862949 RepID=UPI001CD3F938|nr:hypothetical protein [Nocardia sp. alder85J]MCX4099304.1 hypothetical protein [Nocardia sp. alder85J]